MRKSHMIVLATLCTAFTAGCTTSGEIERNAGIGAAIGAVSGAIIGNNVGDGDAGKGAVVGAGIGGVAGAVRGYTRDQKIRECRAVSNPYFYRDTRQNRDYYQVPGKDITCWRNGSPR
jgi:uncharacterized protein YcfJ